MTVDQDLPAPGDMGRDRGAATPTPAVARLDLGDTAAFRPMSEAVWRRLYKAGPSYPLIYFFLWQAARQGKATVRIADFLQIGVGDRRTARETLQGLEEELRLIRRVEENGSSGRFRTYLLLEPPGSSSAAAEGIIDAAIGQFGCSKPIDGTGSGTTRMDRTNGNGSAKTGNGSHFAVGSSGNGSHFGGEAIGNGSHDGDPKVGTAPRKVGPGPPFPALRTPDVIDVKDVDVVGRPVRIDSPPQSVADLLRQEGFPVGDVVYARAEEMGFDHVRALIAQADREEQAKGFNKSRRAWIAAGIMRGWTPADPPAHQPQEPPNPTVRRHNAMAAQRRNESQRQREKAAIDAEQAQAAKAVKGLDDGEFARQYEQLPATLRSLVARRGGDPRESPMVQGAIYHQLSAGNGRQAQDAAGLPR